MNLISFRKNDNLRAVLAETLASPVLKEAMSSLDESAPVQFPLQADNAGDISPTRAAIDFGVCLGYALYAKRLRALATRAPVIPESLEATYGPEIIGNIKPNKQKA